MKPNDPQRAVGKTVAAVELFDFRHNIRFTDGTILQIEPADAEDGAPEVWFSEDSAAD